MTQQQREAVLRLLEQSPLSGVTDMAELRVVFEQMLTGRPVPEDLTLSSRELGGVPVVDVAVAASTEPTTVLHLHGGAYVLGSARATAPLAGSLARAAGGRAVSVDYRLAPENPFPAGLDDAVAAYRALLEETDPEHVVVSGDSAGGGLTVALLMALRDQWLPQPSCAVLFSPWVDLTLSGRSMTGKADVDPVLSLETLQPHAGRYAGDACPGHPSISPVFADLTGLPPLLVQVGTREVLLDDAVRLAATAARDDVEVVLDVTPDVTHVFQSLAPVLDEAADALGRAGTFVRTHVGSPSRA